MKSIGIQEWRLDFLSALIINMDDHSNSSQGAHLSRVDFQAIIDPLFNYSEVIR
ncbi:hypothetical protein HMPREF9374_1536 [Desmospora sp. 8437]|nr:hypothetical protein HMPREF9374_1536 [Desmospora sp. 8437]